VPEEALPFEALLAALRARGLAADVGTYLRLLRVLRAFDGDLEDMEVAVTALVARGPGEVAEVRAIFNSLYRGAPEGRAWAPLVLPIVLLVIGVLGIATAGLWHRREPRPRQVAAQASGPPVKASPEVEAAAAAAVETLRGQAPCPRAPVHHPRWMFYAIMGAVGVSLWGSALLETRRKGREDTRRRRDDATHRELRRDLHKLKGPREYLPVATAAARWQPALVERVAQMISRSGRSPTHEIDVDATVEKTLRAGLFPQIVHRTAYTGALVVLVDVSNACGPYLDDIGALIDAIRKQGVDVERWNFDRAATWVEPEKGGEPVRLEDLADETSHRALWVMTSGEGAWDPEAAAPARWVPSISRWPNRAWVALTDRGRWPSALRRELISGRVFPWSDDGLLAASYTVADARPGDVQWPAGIATPHDIELLKGLLSLARVRTHELAELLRRELLPHAPREVVLAAMPDGTLEVGATEETARARESLRQLDTGEVLERRAHNLIRAALKKEEPPKNSPAWFRWQVEVAVHELWATEKGAEEGALKVLEGLADHAVRAELVHELRAAAPKKLAAGEKVRGILDAAEAKVPAAALAIREPGPLPIPRLPPARGLVKFAAAAAVAVGIGWVWLPGVEREQQLSLEFDVDAGALYISTWDWDIERGALFVDGVESELPFTVDGADGFSGATVTYTPGSCYQATAVRRFVTEVTKPQRAPWPVVAGVDAGSDAGVDAGYILIIDGLFPPAELSEVFVNGIQMRDGGIELAGPRAQIKVENVLFDYVRTLELKRGINHYTIDAAPRYGALNVRLTPASAELLAPPPLQAFTGGPGEWVVRGPAGEYELTARRGSVVRRGTVRLVVGQLAEGPRFDFGQTYTLRITGLPRSAKLTEVRVNGRTLDGDGIVLTTERAIVTLKSDFYAYRAEQQLRPGGNELRIESEPVTGAVAVTARPPDVLIEAPPRLAGRVVERRQDATLYVFTGLPGVYDLSATFLNRETNARVRLVAGEFAADAVLDLTGPGPTNLCCPGPSQLDGDRCVWQAPASDRREIFDKAYRSCSSKDCANGDDFWNVETPDWVRNAGGEGQQCFSLVSVPETGCASGGAAPQAVIDVDGEELRQISQAVDTGPVCVKFRRRLHFTKGRDWSPDGRCVKRLEWAGLRCFAEPGPCPANLPKK